MAFSNETDDSILSYFSDINSKSAALEAFQRWWSHGENEKLGGKLLTRLGDFAAGDPEAIAVLETRAKGNIIWTRSAATAALTKLAIQGDPLATESLQKCEQYWQEQGNSQRKFRQ